MTTRGISRPPLAFGLLVLAAGSCASSRNADVPVSSRQDVSGREDPALRRHDGQVPILFIARRPDIEQDSCQPRAELRGSYFELAVFADGTLAVDGGACVGHEGLFVGKLSGPLLLSLRNLIANSCFSLRRTEMYCSHGQHLRVFCSLDSWITNLHEECGNVGDEFIERVVQLLGMERHLVGDQGDPRGWTRNEVGATVRLSLFAPQPD